MIDLDLARTVLDAQPFSRMLGARLTHIGDDGVTLAVDVRDDLRHAVMIAQIDEQHAAMIALAVHPARKTDGLADIGGAELGAVMGAIGVHGVIPFRIV